MNKIFITEKAILPLQDWANANRKHLRLERDYYDDSQLHLVSNKADVVARIIRKSYLLQFEIKVDGRFVARVEVQRTPDQPADYEYDIKSHCQLAVKAGEKGLDAFIRLIINAYLYANCYLLYGNVTDDESIYLDSCNSGDDKLIYVRKATDNHVSSNTGKKCIATDTEHKTWAVRGYNRKYKNGKVVWVKAHTRGRK